jgi:pSer/pThr/pTyr-binding forkhead associated (FHA) protein
VIAQLVPLRGGPPITINKDISVVGRRSEHCDIIVDRKSISKMHCIIVRTDGLLFVRDLASTNGTKVNGQKILRGALLPGDILAFAGEKFRVHLGPSPAEPVVQPTDQTQAMNARKNSGLLSSSESAPDSDGDVEPLDVEIID